MISNTLTELLKSFYGVQTDFRESPDGFQVGIGVTPIVPVNPNRVGLVFVNNGGAAVYVRANHNPAVGQGIRVFANGGTFVFTWDTDFEMLSQSWNGIADGAASDFYYMEVITTQIRETR